MTFIDLIVLYDRLPAFNYGDTFSYLSAVKLDAALNQFGEKVFWHIDVEHGVYDIVKQRALGQLSQVVADPEYFRSQAARSVLASLAAIRYDWSPSLGELNDRVADDEERRIAQFILGQLVFSGYAQLTGSPHFVAPRRSATLVNMSLPQPERADGPEAAIYDELRRRIRDAGGGWRGIEAPWTPSFVPYLLEQMDVYRQGPDELLKRALDLRNDRAVQDYRRLRRDLLSSDITRSDEAHQQLAAAADRISRSLGVERPKLEITKGAPS